jgi:hypothetical protein
MRARLGLGKRYRNHSQEVFLDVVDMAYRWSWNCGCVSGQAGLWVKWRLERVLGLHGDLYIIELVELVMD